MKKESEHVNASADPGQSGQRSTVHRSQNRRRQSRFLGATHLEPAQEKQLALYLRYQTTHTRAFYKALNELQKLRAEKRKQEIGFVSQERKAAEEKRRRTKDQHARRCTKPVCGSPKPTPAATKPKSSSPKAGKNEPLPPKTINRGSRKRRKSGPPSSEHYSSRRGVSQTIQRACLRAPD